MTDHTQIKQLISAYFDGEATADEQDMILDHIKDCGSCKKFWQDMEKLSSSLEVWTDETLSPDLEQKINKIREGKKMKKKKSLITIGVGSTIIVCLIVSVVALQTYTKRGIQGRTRSASDDIGAQHSVGKMQIVQAPHTASPYSSKAGEKVTWKDVASVEKEEGKKQYEPYYLESRYDVSRGSAATDVYLNMAPVGDGYEWWGETGISKSQPQSAVVDGARSPQVQTYMDRQGYAVSVNGDDGRARLHGIRVSEEEGISYSYATKGKPMPTPEIWVEGHEREGWNTEQYDRIYENAFLEVSENALSTFSIDVDTASYSNLRRYLNNGQTPPKDAVRIEEMVNYFVYDYPQPKGRDPFSITTEAAVCPWNPNHDLVMIGLQGKELTARETPPSNLVFLIDVSGSMNSADKLPLLKNAFKMMVQQLRPEERVSIVTYAGAAGLVLDSAYGNEKGRILQAIDRLRSGGSTAGGQGIKLAYSVAKKNFIRGGNNRVILATDGDFNVGVSSDGELTRIIEEKRKDGIFLTVLGFGTGNYKDSKMEKLADKGNGNYYYIDSLREAQKVLVQELGSMLFTIAKDVKLQIEFNPNQIKAYRLVGYENRILAKEDFNDDTKDAGELGAGHTVTAFYEIVPASSREEFSTVDPLKYQKTRINRSKDLLTVKLRYKRPDENTSKLIEQVLSSNKVKTTNVSNNFKWASAVAEFGLLLRDSKYKANASYNHVLQAARQATGHDRWGYRAEFINLVERASRINPIYLNEQDTPEHYRYK